MKKYSTLIKKQICKKVTQILLRMKIQTAGYQNNIQEGILMIKIDMSNKSIV